MAGQLVKGQSAETLRLPPALRRVLHLEKEVFPKMHLNAVRLLQEVIKPEDQVYFVVKSRSRVDVGGWWTRGKVYALALDHELLCIACRFLDVGPNPYVHRLPYASLRQSVYNHVGAALVLAPGLETTHRHLTMSPLDAYQLLAQIYLEEGATP